MLGKAMIPSDDRGRYLTYQNKFKQEKEEDHGVRRRPILLSYQLFSTKVRSKMNVPFNSPN